MLSFYNFAIVPLIFFSLKHLISHFLPHTDICTCHHSQVVKLVRLLHFLPLTLTFSQLPLWSFLTSNTPLSVALSLTCLTTLSKKLLISYGDITQPRLNPLLTSKYSLIPLPNLTHPLHRNYSYSWLIPINSTFMEHPPQFFSTNFIIRFLQVLECKIQLLHFLFILKKLSSLHPYKT